MKVILRENVPHVGRIGDVVKVADGFGMNYLLPRNLAMLANERNLGQFKHNQAVAAKRLERARADSVAVADKLKGFKLTLTKHAGEEGKLFGSVTTRELADLMGDHGFVFDRRDLTIVEPIKELGEFEVVAKLAGDVSAKFAVIVQAAEV